MTAGSGITHSERFEDLRAHGGTMHGIQAWVALPEADEEIEPAFANHGPDDLPTYESPDGKLWARLVAGKAFGVQAKVKTHSPMFYIHWALKAGGQADIGPEYAERAAYVAQGAVEVDGRRIDAGQMAVLTPGAHVLFTALTDAIVMLLGGEPLGERFIEWNFVSSSKERIEQAKADWRAGRMKLPVADDKEWIPLPGDPPPPANPMS
jgi:redox-sensitive bicupin YhaK (pirin superfamily)